jgi:hypothetical protein
VLNVVEDTAARGDMTGVCRTGADDDRKMSDAPTTADLPLANNRFGGTTALDVATSLAVKTFCELAASAGARVAATGCEAGTGGCFTGAGRAGALA